MKPINKFDKGEIVLVGKKIMFIFQKHQVVIIQKTKKLWTL